jgi:hypothetical protein
LRAVLAAGYPADFAFGVSLQNTWQKAKPTGAAIYALPIGREIDHVRVWKSLL